MKRLLILPAAVLLLAAGCSKKPGGAAKLHDDTDSIAYIIGMNVGKNLLRMDSTLRAEVVCEAILDVFRATPRMTDEQAETYYLGYVNFRLPEKALAYEEQFLEDFARSNRAYARTSSGITYTVEAVGDQNRLPSSDRDSVVMRYVLRTVDGTQLYSSYERGDSTTLALGQMTRGMRESVRMIGKGGKIDVWMPSKVAYGTEGNAELGVGPNATLYYEIEVMEVDKYASRPPRRNNR